MSGHGSRENVAKIFNFLAGLILLLVMIMSCMATFMPWWVGNKFCEDILLTGIGECQSVSASLWTIELDTVIQTEEEGAVEQSMSLSWDQDMCADLATTEGSACAPVTAARAMTILAIITSLFGLVAVTVAHYTTPLLLVVGAFLSMLTTVFAMLGCVMGVMASTNGIGGYGFIFLGGSMVGGAGATAVAFYTAAQAMREEDFHPDRIPREVRAGEARAKAQAAAAALEEHAAKSSGASTTSSQRKKNKFVALRQVLFWNDSKNLHDDDEEIPTELLEKAFREIDENGGGSIDMTELVDALRSCGLNANMTAAEIVMKDIDKNASGDVDIHEFVEFFRYTEELKKMDKKNKRRAQFLSLICNGCFIMHVFGVSALLMVFVKMDKEEAPQTYTLTRTLFIFFCVNLGLLCAFVIVLRAVTITLGPQLVIWQGYYDKHLNDAAERLKAAKMQVQPGNDLRQAAWAKGPVAGLPGPGAVNAAKYGASWRRPKALPPGSDMNEFTGTLNQTGLAGTGYVSTQGGQGTQSGTVHTGIILNRDGGFERYDPASYWQARTLAEDKGAPRSFNTMQVHSIQRPQEDIRMQAVEVQMLALQAADIPGSTQPV